MEKSESDYVLKFLNQLKTSAETILDFEKDLINDPALRINLSLLNCFDQVQNVYENKNYYGNSFEFVNEIIDEYFKSITLLVLNDSKDKLKEDHSLFMSKFQTYLSSIYDNEPNLRIAFKNEILSMTLKVTDKKFSELNVKIGLKIINLCLLTSILLDKPFSKYKFCRENLESGDLILDSILNKEFITFLKAFNNFNSNIDNKEEMLKIITSETKISISSACEAMKLCLDNFKSEPVIANKTCSLLSKKRVLYKDLSGSNMRIASMNSIVCYKNENNKRFNMSQDFCFRIYNTFIYNTKIFIDFLNDNESHESFILNISGPTGVGKTFSLLNLNLYMEELMNNTKLKILSFFFSL